MTSTRAPANVLDGDLPTFFYTATETPAEVFPRIQAAQSQAPIAMGPFGVEVLSHHLVRSVLRDSRFQIPPGINLLINGVDSGPLWNKVVGTILCMEGAPHQRLRSLVSKAFTPRATARLTRTIDRVLNGLVDEISPAGYCDIVTDIARPYPIPIICALLGAPSEDWQKFSHWADEIFRAFSFTFCPAQDEAAVLDAWAELDEYVDQMVARRRHSLTDDLLSDLVRAEDNGDRLNDDELRMLAGGLLLAGTDTTRNQVAASLHVLCEHPEQWALLARRPELAAGAVEETMRHTPIGVGTLRIVVEDAELGGYLFPKNTMVIANSFAANRDPAVYDDPDRFDITRAGGPTILTFGGGVHYCLGANLARRELAEALTIVTQRLPNARVSGPAPWRPMMSISGPIALPVRFDAHH